MSDPNDPDDDYMPRMPASVKRGIGLDHEAARSLAEEYDRARVSIAAPFKNLASCYLNAMKRLKAEERKADSLAEEVILAGENLRIKHNLVLDAEERVRELEYRIVGMR